jgi:hypothetical protein
MMILLQDDLVDSGVEESCGIAASASSKLFAEISGATTWPLSVDFSDLDGTRVTSHVSASSFRWIGERWGLLPSRTASLLLQERSSKL